MSNSHPVHILPVRSSNQCPFLSSHQYCANITKSHCHSWISYKLALEYSKYASICATIQCSNDLLSHTLPLNHKSNQCPYHLAVILECSIRFFALS